MHLTLALRSQYWTLGQLTRLDNLRTALMITKE